MNNEITAVFLYFLRTDFVVSCLILRGGCKVDARVLSAGHTDFSTFNQQQSSCLGPQPGRQEAPGESKTELTPSYFYTKS